MDSLHTHTSSPLMSVVAVTQIFLVAVFSCCFYVLVGFDFILEPRNPGKE